MPFQGLILSSKCTCYAEIVHVLYFLVSDMGLLDDCSIIVINWNVVVIYAGTAV